MRLRSWRVSRHKCGGCFVVCCLQALYGYFCWLNVPTQYCLQICLLPVCQCLVKVGGSCLLVSGSKRHAGKGPHHTPASCEGTCQCAVIARWWLLHQKRKISRASGWIFVISGIHTLQTFFSKADMLGVLSLKALTCGKNC